VYPSANPTPMAQRPDADMQVHGQVLVIPLLSSACKTKPVALIMNSRRKTPLFPQIHPAPTSFLDVCMQT
jgi:hypothetical protein